jgi:hypothetical protein
MEQLQKSTKLFADAVTLPWNNENFAVRLTSRNELSVQSREVAHVQGIDCSSMRRREPQVIVVRTPFSSCVVGRQHVNSAAAKR